MMTMMAMVFLIGMAVLVSTPPARLFTWTLGTENDLASYQLWQQVGHCLNNTNPWAKVKTVGVQDHLWYAPPTYGTYCFYLTAMDTSGNASPRSNKVQLN